MSTPAFFFSGKAAACLLCILLSYACLFSAGSACAATNPDSRTIIRIGVLAKRGPVQCLKKWQATADYLTENIPGTMFTIIPLTFEQINKTAAESKTDFILTNPSLYVELEIRFGAARIATMRNTIMGRGHTKFGGVLFTRRKSSVKNLQDMRGKTLAAVSPDSLGGWRMAEREIRDHLPGGTEALGAVIFVNTHDKVVETVLAGDADVGTVRTDTLERMQEEGKVDLRHIAVIPPASPTAEGKRFPFRLSTRLYPEWAMAKLRHTPDDLARRVAAALLEMEPGSRAALDARISGWTAPLDYQPVHDLMRELKAGPYTDYGKVSLPEAARQHSFELGALLLFLAVLAGFAAYSARMNTRLRQARILAEQRLETLLAEAKRRRDVENMVRHELRTPLVSILSGLNYLNDSDNLTEDQQRITAMAWTWGDKMLKVITLSQALTGMEEGTFLPIQEPVNMRRVIREAARESDEQAKSGNISVRLIFGLKAENGSEDEIVHGDPLLLNILISNLIRNAVEASPPNEKVRVILESGPPIVVRVCNQGTVPEDIRDVFFEKYVTSGKKGGTGLGTYTARLIARSHGGDLTMTTSEENGTEVRAVLPQGSAPHRTDNHKVLK